MPKPRPNRLGMYADVKEILDQCIAHNGGSYALHSYGAAVHWRQRAYRFRKMFAETLPEGELSPYDVLTFPKIEEGSKSVVVVKQQAKGVFTPNEAAVAVATPPEEVDDLLADAMNLAERLDKGEGR